MHPPHPHAPRSHMHTLGPLVAGDCVRVIFKFPAQPTLPHFVCWCSESVSYLVTQLICSTTPLLSSPLSSYRSEGGVKEHSTWKFTRKKHATCAVLFVDVGFCLSMCPHCERRARGSRATLSLSLSLSLSGVCYERVYRDMQG